MDARRSSENPQPGRFSRWFGSTGPTVCSGVYVVAPVDGSRVVGSRQGGCGGACELLSSWVLQGKAARRMNHHGNLQKFPPGGAMGDDEHMIVGFGCLASQWTTFPLLDLLGGLGTPHSKKG